jgi:hypothetical protein
MDQRGAALGAGAKGSGVNQMRRSVSLSFAFGNWEAVAESDIADLACTSTEEVIVAALSLIHLVDQRPLRNILDPQILADNTSP